jgi:hypothetical protein
VVVVVVVVVVVPPLVVPPLVVPPLVVPSFVVPPLVVPPLLVVVGAATLIERLAVVLPPLPVTVRVTEYVPGFE